MAGAEDHASPLDVSGICIITYHVQLTPSIHTPHRIEQLPQAAGPIAARATTSAAAAATAAADRVIIEWTIARGGSVDGEEGGTDTLGMTMAPKAAGGGGGGGGGPSRPSREGGSRKRTLSYPPPPRRGWGRRSPGGTNHGGELKNELALSPPSTREMYMTRLQLRCICRPPLTRDAKMICDANPVMSLSLVNDNINS